MKVLLTGFEPFGDIAVNPSQLVIEAMAHHTLPDMVITAEVLPTEYQAAGARVRELIETISPDVVLSIGVAAGRKGLHLERVALNLDDARLPDNAGQLCQGSPITDDGAPAYFSNMPLADLKASLLEKNVPVTISNHAGAYVCNHVFYSAMHTINELGLNTLCSFLHIPAIPDDYDQHAQLALLGIVKSVEYILEVLQERITNQLPVAP